MNDADRWSLFAAHALQGLLAAPLGSIAPDQVLTIDALSTMAASFADEMALQWKNRFAHESAIERQIRREAALQEVRRAASASAERIAADLGAPRDEHLTLEQYVELEKASGPKS